MARQKPDAYERITQTIIDKIEQSNTLPWHKPWRDNPNLSPSNLISKKAYRGMNSLLLDGGYNSNYWLTFKQAKGLGGTVRKGEKGTMIAYWQFTEFKNKDADPDEKGRIIPLCKTYTVFNLHQCNGIEEPASDFKGSDIEPDSKAQAIADNYISRYDSLTFRHEGNQAFFKLSSDLVVMPAMEQFKNSDEYYSTLFHELGHSTGHHSRLNRDMSGHFGNHAYSKEELVAEFTACFLCREAGINSTVDNSAAYLKNWVSKFREQPKLLMQAASQATKAVDLIIERQATRSIGID